MVPVRECDFLIVGGGIAGASAGYNLASHGRVIIVERESQPGYHTTGRSAAFYSETYGNATIRALTTGSRHFYLHPPAGFTDVPLLSPSGALYLARAEQRPTLERLHAEGSRLVDNLRWLTTAEILARVPVIRPEAAVLGLLEPDSMSIDVHALHQGFLRGVRAQGGAVLSNAECLGLTRRDGRWQVATRAGTFIAPVLIDAAGAWADELAGLAGAAPVGLVPKRRTVLVFDPPTGVAVKNWPLVIDADEKFYFKPDAGRILASPADETPMPPCDVQPDELDIALCVDRLQQATSLPIKSILRKWAGLRSFVADKTPVVGFDPQADGFFWLAGQGGYGIQTAPAMGQLVAALATGAGVPAELVRLGVREAELSPARFRR